MSSINSQYFYPLHVIAHNYRSHYYSYLLNKIKSAAIGKIETAKIILRQSKTKHKCQRFLVIVLITVIPKFVSKVLTPTAQSSIFSVHYYYHVQILRDALKFLHFWNLAMISCRAWWLACQLSSDLFIYGGTRKCYYVQLNLIKNFF